MPNIVVFAPQQVSTYGLRDFFGWKSLSHLIRLSIIAGSLFFLFFQSHNNSIAGQKAWLGISDLDQIQRRQYLIIIYIFIYIYKYVYLQHINTLMHRPRRNVFPHFSTYTFPMISDVRNSAVPSQSCTVFSPYPLQNLAPFKRLTCQPVRFVQFCVRFAHYVTLPAAPLWFFVRIITDTSTERI